MKKKHIIWMIGTWGTVFLLYGILACSNDLITNPLVDESVAPIGDPTVDVSNSSATIKFSTNKDVTVRIEYGTGENSLLTSTPQTEATSRNHTVTLSDLRPSTTYYYRIVMYRGYAKPYLSSTLSFTTSDIGLTADPSVTADEDSAVILFSTNNNVTTLVEYGTSQTNLSFALPPTSTPSTSHNRSIENLVPNTTYYYRIKLITGDTVVSTSSIYSFTTASSESLLAIKQRGIWVVGGISGAAVSTVVSQLDLYDPVTDTWYPDVANGASGTYTPVSFAAYAAYNDKIYVIGGFDKDGTCKNTVQIYDVVNNSWSTGQDLLAPRANIHAALYQGKIYVIGGTAANAGNLFAAQNTTYEYNIQGNSWATLLALGAVANRLSVPYEGVVYHMGGKTAATTYVNTHDGYVIATNTATTGATEVVISSARAGMAGALISPPNQQSFVLIVGGISASVGTNGAFINQGTTGATLLNLVQYLHPPFTAPRTWMTNSNNFPVSIAFGALAYSTATKHVYHFGGTQALGTGAAGQAMLYRIPLPPDPPTNWVDTWASCEPMPRSRWGHGAVSFTN